MKFRGKDSEHRMEGHWVNWTENKLLKECAFRSKTVWATSFRAVSRRN